MFDEGFVLKVVVSFCVIGICIYLNIWNEYYIWKEVLYGYVYVGYKDYLIIFFNI